MRVINVKFIKNQVEIILDDGSFFISKENYIENPLTIDSYVDEKKIASLLRQEKVIESKIELIKLLNIKALTELEIKKKLIEKNLDYREVEIIIESLKRSGLINDEYVGILMVESLLMKKRGRLEIVKELKIKGINDEIIKKLVSEIDESDYKNNFDRVCEKYLKIYSNKVNRLKEQMIISKLKEYGYEADLIESINIVKNDDEEVSLAKQSIIKMIRNKSVDLNNYENLNKIKSKLVMKGFSYAIINLALEEVIKDEAY